MRNRKVEDWFEASDHPLHDIMYYLREVIMEQFPQIDESIKWKSPTFEYKGNIASFNPRTKKHVSLMFHTGASIEGEFPSLQGDGDTTRYMKIATMDEALNVSEELKNIMQTWCRMKDLIDE